MALLTLSFFAAGAILIYWNRDRIRSAALRDKMLKKRTDPAQANSLNAETPIQPERKPDPLLDGWSLGLLRDLDWRRFEEVVAEYERLLGNQPRLGAIGPDGGIDLRIIDATSGQVSRLVQCKAHSSLVKVDAVRAFYGVMHSEKVDRGTFYATDGFPNVAKDFVAGKNLELIDGETLIARIRQLELPVQIRLFNFAIEGDYKSATCARCTKKMVLATNRNNRRHWRCRCGNTLWARAE